MSLLKRIWAPSKSLESTEWPEENKFLISFGGGPISSALYSLFANGLNRKAEEPIDKDSEK